jgi:hypothetical protein
MSRLRGHALRGRARPPPGRRIELRLLQPSLPVPRIDAGGGEGEMGERGVAEREHAPQFLARARRIRTMHCG